MKIELPDDGHTWKELKAPYIPANETCFGCECGALFVHDMIDDSTEYDEGDGHSYEL